MTVDMMTITRKQYARDIAAELAPLHDALRTEQSHLWDELADDVGRAVNGVWSMGAANRARRIVRIARLIGPTDAGNVPYRLVAGGVYDAVLAAGRLTPPHVWDEAEWQRSDRLMANSGGGRDVWRPLYAATVVRIQQDAGWVSGDEDG